DTLNKLSGKSIPALSGVIGHEKCEEISRILAVKILCAAQPVTEVILSKLDIAHIARTQIERFDVQELEDMINEVSRKELKFIEWIGAPIGAVMAFANILIQNMLV
ncbi:MAG: DUF445 family protein, partial [Candidatus Wallbacteria bacterium]|nr:DUF445 family protein [Candidatus Wallbacteria bacterium]